VAIGYTALNHNTTGDFNTASGAGALFSNTTGIQNTATGVNALESNTEGNVNTANGNGALSSNTNGLNNTAIGGFALQNNNTGSANTAVGTGALPQATGNGNIGLGFGAGSFVTTANNVICIGANVGGPNVDNSCFIGNIYQKQVGNDSLPVRVDSFGKLGTEVSSKRFKRDVAPMDHASEVILALRPVTFHYKSDSTNKPQFGLIAEEVAEANPDLVVRDKNGEIYTVRYDAVNAMLLNEFLKEHRRVEEQARKTEDQRATFADLKSMIAQQEKTFQSKFAEQERQIKALKSGLQKVSAQLELNKPAQQTVANDP
jgi:hypothetical protein